jgi:hypothetical protein
MNREIRVIKRAARELLEVGSMETVKALGCNEVKETPSLQMTRTIKEWISARRQKATEELSAARSLKRIGY